MDPADPVSDLKPVECSEPGGTCPLSLGALNGSFHIHESDQQSAFENQNTFLSLQASAALEAIAL